MSLEDLTYRELQKLCAEKNINGKGTKKILLERLQAHFAESLLEKSEAQEEPKQEISDFKKLTNSLAEKEEQEVNVLVDGGRLITDPRVVKEESISLGLNAEKLRMDRLIHEIEELFAGRATVTHEEEDCTLHFHGGPRKIQCVTTRQPDAKILQFARIFISRAFVAGAGSNVYSSVGEMGGGF